jgi:Uma2 family endonuclease
VFSDYHVLQPDIVYFGPQRRRLVNLDTVIRHPPDLCVEILSPSTARRDRGRKRDVFARFGVKEYWIVDPAAVAFEAHELAGGRYQLRERATEADSVSSPLLPGLSLSVRPIFQDLL